MFAKLILVVVIAFSPTYALADLITFDNFTQAPLGTPHTEGPFTYAAGANTSYAVFNNVGNPLGPSGLGGLMTGGGTLGTVGGATPGATLNIILTLGGLFTFNSVERSSICSPNFPSFNCFLFDPPPGVLNPDVQSVDILGIRGGVQQYSIMNVFTTTNTFSTVNNLLNAGTPIDLLQLRINRAGTGRQIFDNFNLTVLPSSVAEPSTMLLLLSGLAGLFFRSRKE